MWVAVRVWLVVLLVVSCAGPDRFGVGANATQSDWMRADSSTFLANDTGMGYGVGVWAEWDLRKQSQPITFDWPDRPPFYLANRPANNSQPVLQPETEDKPDRIDQGINAAQALDGMQPATQIILLVLGLAAVVGIIIVAHLRTKQRSPKP